MNIDIFIIGLSNNSATLWLMGQKNTGWIEKNERKGKILLFDKYVDHFESFHW